MSGRLQVTRVATEAQQRRREIAFYNEYGDDLRALLDVVRKDAQHSPLPFLASITLDDWVQLAVRTAASQNML